MKVDNNGGHRCPTCKQFVRKKRQDASYIKKCEKVLAAVVEGTGITEAAIIGRSRDRAVVRARWLVSHIAHDHLGIQKVLLSEFFGQDHSTIYAALDSAHVLYENDDDYAAKYKEITEGMR